MAEGTAHPYMDDLRMPSNGDAADPDRRLLSDDDLEAAAEEGTGNRSTYSPWT